MLTSRHIDEIPLITSCQSGMYDCPVCNFLICDTIDAASYQRSGLCSSCEMDFYDRKRTDWETGWRPSEKEVNEVVTQRRTVPFRVIVT